MSRFRLLTIGVAVAITAAACGSSEPLILAQPSTTTSTTTTVPDGPAVEAVTVSLTELEVGMCSDTPDIDGSGGELRLIDCDEPHRYEVFAEVPQSAILIGEEGEAAAVQTACESASFALTGVRAEGSLVGVIGFAPPSGDGVVCVHEAPDQRVDFFARAPLDLPPVQVTRAQLGVPSAASFAIVTDVASDGDDVVVVVGRTDGTDLGSLDAAIWRSGNGGASFSPVDDASLRINGTAEIPESVVPLGGAFLAIGTSYGDADPQPWALVSNASGTSWTPLAVPLDGFAGAELRFAVTRPDGTVEVVGSLYDRRGLRRPAVWTWGGFALSQPFPLVTVEENPDANLYVEAAFADSLGVTVQVTDLFANFRRGFRSTTPDEWTSFNQVPSLQFATAVVEDATFAMRGGELTTREAPGAGWVRVELPGHDGARADARSVATDGETVLAVGSMAAVQGTTAAFWHRPPRGDFELIYFDVDQAGRRDRPVAATAVGGGFLVAGTEDPEFDDSVVPVVWLVGSP